MNNKNKNKLFKDIKSKTTQIKPKTKDLREFSSVDRDFAFTCRG